MPSTFQIVILTLDCFCRITIAPPLAWPVVTGGLMLSQLYEPINRENERLAQLLQQADLSHCSNMQLIQELYLRGFSEEQVLHEVASFYYAIGETLAGADGN